MSNVPIRLFVFLTVCFFVQRPILPAQNHLQDSADVLVDEGIALFPEKTVLAIAIITDDSVLVSHRGFNDDSTYFSTFFEIGSITKVMTSMVLSALVEEGVVSLDDRIDDFFDIDFSNEAVAGITLLQLSNHTSGLPRLPPDFMSPDLSNPYATMDQEALMESLRKVKLLTGPGKSFAYSNFGAALLARALVLKTGQSFEDLLSQYVFDRAGMTYSTTERKSLDSTEVIQGLGWAGTPTSYWYFNAFEGAGAVYSNLRDMVQFVRFLIDGPAYVTSMRSATMDLEPGGTIGMGILRARGEKNVFWHNGGTGGFRSCMAYDPDLKIGAVVLSNVSGFHMKAAKIDELCFKLLGLLQ